MFAIRFEIVAKERAEKGARHTYLVSRDGRWVVGYRPEDNFFKVQPYGLAQANRFATMSAAAEALQAWAQRVEDGLPGPMWAHRPQIVEVRK